MNRSKNFHISWMKFGLHFVFFKNNHIEDARLKIIFWYQYLLKLGTVLSFFSTNFSKKLRHLRSLVKIFVSVKFDHRLYTKRSHFICVRIMGKIWILRIYWPGNLLESYYTCPRQITNTFICTQWMSQITTKNAKLYYNIGDGNGGLRLCQFDFIFTITAVRAVTH